MSDAQLSEGDVLRRMYRLTADQERPFESKVPDLLDLGREYLGVEVGFLTEIDGDTRQFTVECDVEPTVTNVDFNGKDNADITADKEHVEGIVIYKQDGKLQSTAGEWLNTTASVRKQLDINNSNSNSNSNDVVIVAIAFPADGISYIHPGWNGHTVDASASSSSAVQEPQIVHLSWLDGYDATNES